MRLHHTEPASMSRPTATSNTVRSLLRPLAFALALVGSTQVVAHADSGPAKDCIIKDNNPNADFTSRLLDSYSAHFKVTNDPANPPTQVDGVNVPENNPPYPYATWNVGGTQVIGFENMTYGPLMDALYCGSNGQAIKDSRVTVYGWIEPGFNISTSKSKFNFSTGSGGNYPAAYNYAPNTAQVDQVALYIERTPDEVQKDHWDWGFRLSGLYGTDYKYTLANDIGPAAKQYQKYGQKYGFDPVMEYLDVYDPFVADGMNIRIGRYISIPDIEAQLAPNNLTYSHSLLYTYDPFTHTGIVDTIKLNKNWTIQGELSAGNDVALWDHSNRKLSPTVCVNWTSDSGNDGIYPCYNSANGGKFAYNNINQAVTTWYHKFNDKWHMDTEFWYMWEKETPNVNNAAGQSLLASQFPDITYGAPSGAQCNNQNVLTCTSRELALVNYIEYTISGRDFITVRNEYFHDMEGQRTGYKTAYSEHLIGWTHWIGDTVTIRPEIRYEHSYGADAYDNPSGTLGGGKRTQVTFASDVIFHF